MIETREATIRGTRYKVQQLGSKDGRKLFVRLVRILGPSISELLNSSDSVAGIMDQDLSSFGPAIKELCTKALELEVDHLCDTFMPMTQICVDESRDAWKVLTVEADMHFAGNYKEMFEWLWFCLKVNFQDFIPGSAELGSAG